MSGIGPLPVGERSLGGEESGGGGEGNESEGERRRGGRAGQTDVSEQSERWRLIDWFVGGRIISRTRTAPTHYARLIALIWHRLVYVYHGQYI